MTTDAEAFGIPGEQTPDGPAALREAYEKEKAARKAAEAELQKERDAQAAQAKTDKVTAFVKEKGLPDKAVEMIGDSDPEEWFNSYGEFVVKSDPNAQQNPPKPAEPAPEASGPVGESGLSAEQRQAIAAVTSAEPLPFDPNDTAAREAYLDGATSAADFEQRLGKLGLIAGAQSRS